MPFNPEDFGPAPTGMPASSPGGFNPDSFGPAPTAPPTPGGLEAVGRGALQGATFGFADEISGALEALFSDKTYEQARNESRTNFKAAETAHPWLSTAGNIAGSLPTLAIPGLNVAKGAGLAKTAINLGAQGAVAGLGGSDASLVGPGADSTAVLGDTALGGILGAGIGAIAHGSGKLIAGAPEAAKLDRSAAVLEGEGIHGRVGKKEAQKLARDVEGVDDVLTAKFHSLEAGDKGKTISLDEIMRKPAKEVAPVVKERLKQVAGKLDDLYEPFDKKTGGLNLADFANHVKEETAALAQTPDKEKHVAEMNRLLSSALKSWAPGMEEKLAANARGAELGLEEPIFSDVESVNVPFSKFREFVTNLQSKVPGEAPTEATEIKKEVAKNFKEFLNNRLEGIADDHPDLAPHFKELMSTNREIAALSGVRDAIDQRLWKEASGSTSAKGHIASMVGHGVGATAGGMIGGPIGAGVGAVVGGAAAHAVQGGLTKARGAALRQLEHASQRIAELKTAAAGGSQHAALLLHVIENTPEIATRIAALHGTQ